MKYRNIVVAASALFITACASNAKNPIGNEVITNYKASAISVTLMEGKKIPDRYDKAARDYLNEGANETEKVEFEVFSEGLAPSAESDEDYTGEAFLTWLIQRRLDGRTQAMLRGETDASLGVQLKSTTWPNTATMMLVGEMIGTKFEFSLIDEENEIVVESIGEISPFVQRSAGAGGGLLGMALRSGNSQHLTDLERVADATAALVMDILTASELPQATLKTYKFRGTTASEIATE